MDISNHIVSSCCDDDHELLDFMMSEKIGSLSQHLRSIRSGRRSSFPSMDLDDDLLSESMGDLSTHLRQSFRGNSNRGLSCYPSSRHSRDDNYSMNIDTAAPSTYGELQDLMTEKLGNVTGHIRRSTTTVLRRSSMPASTTTTTSTTAHQSGFSANDEKDIYNLEIDDDADSDSDDDDDNEETFHGFMEDEKNDDCNNMDPNPISYPDGTKGSSLKSGKGHHAPSLSLVSLMMNNKNQEQEEEHRIDGSVGSTVTTADSTHQITNRDESATTTVSASSCNKNLTSQQDPQKEYTASLERLNANMMKSSLSEMALVSWDRKLGLPKNHSKKLAKTSKSRKKLQEGALLQSTNISDALQYAAILNSDYSSLQRAQNQKY